MDDFDRFMSRQRALRRASAKGRKIQTLWNFEKWGGARTEDHHPGRRKFSPDRTLAIPIPMHEELTRRGEEEHPPLGPDPSNQLERIGRLHLGLSDMHAALSDAHWQLGVRMLAAVGDGARDISAMEIPKGLLGWMERIAHDLAEALVWVREAGKGK